MTVTQRPALESARRQAEVALAAIPVSTAPLSAIAPALFILWVPTVD